MRQLPLRTAIYLAVLGALSTTAAAAKPVSFVCSFPSQKMSLTFVVDPATAKTDGGGAIGTATLVGNAGTETVQMIVGANAVSFIERVVSGAVQTTTVQTRTLNAVHSRHTIMGVDDNAEFVPSQSRGTCERRD